MSALPLSGWTFKVRRDQVSDQVSCDQDAKFWFRMESAEDRDNITDSSLGAFDLPSVAISWRYVTRRSLKHLTAALFSEIFFLPAPAMLQQSKRPRRASRDTLRRCWQLTAALCIRPTCCVDVKKLTS